VDLEYEAHTENVVNEESEFEIREIAEKLNINLGGGLEGNFKM
jgi:hypothetical protein